LWSLSQAVIAARSYVLPSEPMTGSVMGTRVIGHRSSSGTCILRRSRRNGFRLLTWRFTFLMGVTVTFLVECFATLTTKVFRHLGSTYI